MSSRAPFQVIVFPYLESDNGEKRYAIFRRSDNFQWQGISGGGEANETPLYAARRESFEEAGISKGAEFIRLESISYLPVTQVVQDYIWGEDCLVIPQYSFGVKVSSDKFELSGEHVEYRWLSAVEAAALLKWDSNRNALWELNKRLETGRIYYRRRMKHRIRAAALIFNDKDEILLVQHVHPQTGEQWWVPPGGGLEDCDRSIFECADREVYEETGLSVSTENIAYIREFQDNDTESLNIEIFCTTGKYSGDLTIKNICGNGPDEHYIKDVRWFSKDALKQVTVYPEELKGNLWKHRDSVLIDIKYLGRQIG